MFPVPINVPTMGVSHCWTRKLSDESQGARASIKAARVAEASAFFPHVGTRKGKDLYTKYVYIPLKEYDNM